MVLYCMVCHCIAWNGVVWCCMAWWSWCCMVWQRIALHMLYGVALYVMVWHSMAWFAVLFVHEHCCWDSRFGVLPRRAITLLHPKTIVEGCLYLKGNGLLWSERNGLLWSKSVIGYYGACMIGYCAMMVVTIMCQFSLQCDIFQSRLTLIVALPLSLTSSRYISSFSAFGTI